MRTFTYILSLIVAFLLTFSSTHAQIITTVAGTDSSGYNGDNIPATTAQLQNPTLLTVDASGNIIIADTYNNRVRKVSTSGIITTIAGTGVAGYNGDSIAATNAQLNNPYGVAVDNAGNLYICDPGNNRVRKVNTMGIITTIIGTGISGYIGDNGAAATAQLYNPHDVIVDGSGNIYVSDYGNNCVRKVNTAGIITTIAGGGVSGDGGQATAAFVSTPIGIALDGSGNLYIAEDLGACIRKVNSTGIITTIAGKSTGGSLADNIPATDAGIHPQIGVAVDALGSVYLCEADANIVRKVTPDGIIHTIAGTGVGGFNGDGGIAINAELHGPAGIALDAAGNIYIGDFYNSRIRRMQSTVFVKNISSSDPEVITYPNPSSGVFKINISSLVDERVALYIINIAGEKIKEIETVTNKPVEIQMSVASGMYFLVAKTTQGIISQKIIIRAESP